MLRKAIGEIAFILNVWRVDCASFIHRTIELAGRNLRKSSSPISAQNKSHHIWLIKAMTSPEYCKRTEIPPPPSSTFFSISPPSGEERGKKNSFYLVAISYYPSHLHCLMLYTSEKNLTPFCWPHSWHLFNKSIWENWCCHLSWIWTSHFKSGGAVSAGQVSFHLSQVCLVLLYTSYRIRESTDILLVVRLDKL